MIASKSVTVTVTMTATAIVILTSARETTARTQAARAGPNRSAVTTAPGAPSPEATWVTAAPPLRAGLPRAMPMAEPIGTSEHRSVEPLPA